eukprot:1807401-Karenia_brevis.AAC.1
MGKQGKKRPAAANPEPDTAPKKKKKQGVPASSGGGEAYGASGSASSSGGFNEARRWAFCNTCHRLFRIPDDDPDQSAEIVYMSCPRCE